MEKYLKYRMIPFVVSVGSVLLIILDRILKWKLPVVLLWAIFIISLAWAFHSLALFHTGEKYASKWIDPEDITLKACGYRFLREYCPGNKPEFTNYQLFIAGGGDRDLFLKTVSPVKSMLDEGETWLKPLCLIGGFSDIYDWEKLPLKAKIEVMQYRWLFKMRDSLSIENFETNN